MQPDPTSPIDLASLTREQMAGFVGEVFTMELPEDGATVAMTLAEVRPLGTARPDQRTPFALLFRPATPQFYATQRIYPFLHARLGRLEIFVVPVRPDAHGARFEAVFT